MPYHDYIYTQETATTQLVWGSLRLAPIIDLTVRMSRSLFPNDNRLVSNNQIFVLALVVTSTSLLKLNDEDKYRP